MLDSTSLPSWKVITRPHWKSGLELSPATVTSMPSAPVSSREQGSGLRETSIRWLEVLGVRERPGTPEAGRVVAEAR